MKGTVVRDTTEKLGGGPLTVGTDPLVRSAVELVPDIRYSLIALDWRPGAGQSAAGIKRSSPRLRCAGNSEAVFSFMSPSASAVQSAKQSRGPLPLAGCGADSAAESAFRGGSVQGFAGGPRPRKPTGGDQEPQFSFACSSRPRGMMGLSLGLGVHPLDALVRSYFLLPLSISASGGRGKPSSGAARSIREVSQAPNPRRRPSALKSRPSHLDLVANEERRPMPWPPLHS